MDKITLTSQQLEGLNKVVSWAETAGPGDIFRIFGYAGTGKSTIVEQLADRIGRERVVFTAFTGKACEVLTRKGCPAQTIHSLIYNAQTEGKSRMAEIRECLEELHPKSKEARELNKELERLVKKALEPSFGFNESRAQKTFEDIGFIIVDECSMIDQTVGEDLIAVGKPLIVMGDPGQLPPPKGLGYFTPPNIKPDVMLTEIHRQSEDSAILTAATKARQNIPLRFGRDGIYGEMAVIPRARLTTEQVLSADLIIVGTNKTRRTYNQRIRELKGFKGWPKQGERLICLKNNRALNFQNGGLFEVIEDAVYIALDDQLCVKVKNLNTDVIVECNMWAFHFRDEEPSRPWWEYDSACEFYYGYAITCHKAQGSQANHVLVIDESKYFRADASKWLYTAITRAARSCIIAK